MPKPSEFHVNDIEIGSGELFIDVHDKNGALTGERYLGDAVSASLSAESERLQVFSGSGQVAQELVNKVRSIARTMTITLHDMSPDNLALFLSATKNVTEVGAAATKVADQAIAIPNTLRWYQLGATKDNPRGVGKIVGTDFGVKADGTVVAQTESDGTFNYRLDLDRGRLYITDSTKGKAIVAATAVTVTYTPAAPARKTVKTGEIEEVVGAIRYLEDTATGKGRDYYIPKATIAPSGEMALMSRETEQQIVLTAAIQNPGGSQASVYIDGEDATQ